MADEQPTCETCRYWLERTNPSEGQCRRSPPVLVPQVLDQMLRHKPPADAEPVTEASDCLPWFWPTTEFDDWCGEHRPRE